MNSQYITTTVTCSKFKALRTVRLACRPHASGFAQKCARRAREREIEMDLSHIHVEAKAIPTQQESSSDI